MGILIAQQIDRLMGKRLFNYESDKLVKTLSEGNKYGQMMHYYPVRDKIEEEWFQWHNDYSILTALTSAMYLD